ncbi:hypothetical protein ACLB2K_066162 [Fragaria x ananassa]
MAATILAILLWMAVKLSLKATKFSLTVVNFSLTAADFSCQSPQSIIASLFPISDPNKGDVRDYLGSTRRANVLVTPVNLATEDAKSTNSTARFFRFALCTGQGLTVVRLSVTISILGVRSSSASTGKKEKKDKAPRSVHGKESKDPRSLKGKGLLRQDALASGYD